MIEKPSSSNLPRVAVIIPVYNAERYIAETLESAFSQTYANVDVICIDDCSQDNSVNTIRGYQQNMPSPERLNLIVLSQNSGPSVARNRGIEQAKGEYILPLDADDKIDPTYIDKAVNCFLKDPSIDVVYCKAATFGAEEAPCDFPPYNPQRIAVANMVFATALFRKSDWAVYNGYNENMRNGLEDWDFWLCFTEDNKKFHRIDETLFHYRQYGESRSTTARRNLSSLMKQIRKNHPALYTLKAYLSNKYLRKDALKKVRKWLIQIRLKKNRRIIRVFGIYFLREANY